MNLSPSTPYGTYRLPVSLPQALLGGEKARRIIETCTTDLWTPAGMRSLAATDPRYRGHYSGNAPERDGAYHQGTVWPWLLSAFATAHYRVYHNPATSLEFANAIPAHMREACIGQVSEIMEGDPPFAPRGCFAQAWSIGQILRANREINGCERRGHKSHALHEAAGTARPRDGIR
jgi:glycogen debranching enzyme